MKRTFKAVGAFVVLVALGIFLPMLFAPSVGAAEVTTVNQVTETVPATVALEPWVVAILIGTVTPIATGIATKLSASSGVKALVGLAFVALGTVLNLIAQNDGVLVVRDVVVLFACTFAMHVSTYYGLWKPIGGGSAPMAKTTKGIGVG